MTSPIQLVGGKFQDSEGNVLALGYLKMRLSQDGTVVGVGSICAGIEITIRLNASGSVDTVTAQYVWGNDEISPVNTYYTVTGYTAEGQAAWGPNVQQVVGFPSGPGTFDVGTWIPNTVISWLGTVLAPPVAIAVNGALAADQQLINLIATTGMTITDLGNGQIEFTNTATGVVIEVNGAPLATPSPANFTVGAGLSISNPSAGTILLTNTVPPGAGFSTAGSGGFLGPGVLTSLYALAWGVSAQPLDDSANVLDVFQFVLEASWTIRNCTFVWSNNYPGTGSFGIYSAAGALLIDSGTFNFESPTNTPVENSFTAVTLPPGVYWFAQAGPGAGVTCPG